MTDMMIPDVDKVPTATTTTKDDEEPEATMAMDVVIEAEAEEKEAENEATNRRTNSPTPETGRSLLSAPTAITPYHQRPTTTLFSTSSHKEEPAVTTPLLSLYYQHLFPYDFIYQWFRYGTGGATNTIGGNNNHHSAMNLFLHREFSFTIQNSHTDDEIYIRYQSFSNLNDFQAAIQKRLPIKIDIGAIFSHPPVQKHTFATSNNALSTFQPMEREFVLDIDLTDYDDVRNCGCQSANICPICWKYMYMAMETINTALYEDFQFQHVQWFYSGRRGIHGWVCDAAAKALTDQGRTAIANYLTVTLGNEKNQDVHLSFPLHPYIHRAYEILEPYFIRDVIVAKKHGGHGLLCSEDQYMKVLNLLPDCVAAVRERLHDNWTTQKSTPLEKWNELKKHVAYHIKHGDLSGSGGSGGGNKNTPHNERSKKMAKTYHINYEVEKNRQLLELFCVEVVLRYTYPRIDINVSKMRNHLLKSPFCVHPKTGRVCVPISKTEYRTFDPFTVPTISQIVQEYFAATKAETAAAAVDDENLDTTDAEAVQSNDDIEADMVMSKEIATNQSQRSGKSIGKNHSNKHKWECTSLYPYYTKFQNEFLIPLMKESQSQQRQNVTDRNDARNMDF